MSLSLLKNFSFVSTALLDINQHFNTFITLLHYIYLIF